MIAHTRLLCSVEFGGEAMSIFLDLMTSHTFSLDSIIALIALPLQV